ncbi:hypothetical protein [Paenibacillus sp. HW567]|uniref:hypothetical protein n=1 Tax=Paenibacillus sp. HW567 TaxID=1034769 RepID=UPI000364B88C|nr:hypothetical protein [Paenibacillus sp. HW567]
MFRMCLQQKSELHEMTIEKKIYDDELDNESSVILDICKYLHQTRSIDFIVSGFGSEGWPVDCEFDLPSIIEELPEIIQKFNNNEYNCNLGFYEQGIMREIAFRDEGGEQLLLECRSLMLGWEPSPSTIEMNKSIVKKMLENLFGSFINFSQKVCPELLSEKLFRDWISMNNNSYN